MAVTRTNSMDETVEFPAPVLEVAVVAASGSPRPLAPRWHRAAESNLYLV